MRYWVLFNTIVFAVSSRNGISSATPFHSPAVKSTAQHKQQLLLQSASIMHRQIRGKLLSASTRAAIAASAGSYALPSSEREAGQAHREGWRSNAYSGGWVRPSYPAAALSGAASRSKSGNAGAGSVGPLGFRGPSGTCIAGETLPAALQAWPWKNPQGILVSPMDHRQYRWLVLPNGLQVMVISDPKASKAAAAMSVDVGAASDPPGLPGLAHFCEHMLFLGTSKYPAENAYKSYLSKHGGRSNASTAMDNTTYKFEVGAEHLRGALDIFSQFFVSPLFSESSTGRELLAVDSEDSKNRTNDSRRILQVLKALADQDHPYSKYSTGNLKTLKDDVPEGLDTRDELLAFHGKHYHARNMALVVLGKEDLDHLEAWARDSFREVRDAGEVEATSASIKTDDVAPLAAVNGDEGLAGSSGGVSAVDRQRAVAAALAETMRSPWRTPPALVVDLEPLRSLRKLMIQWPMPPVRKMWRNSPTRVLSHLMGHEGPGSLFATLQDRGLATSVSSGLRTAHDDFSLLQVEIGLTKEGQEHWEDVAALVHEHARMVRELPAEDARRAWQESRDMGAIYLRFQQEVSPYAAATSLARRLQLYPSREVLSAGGVLDLEIDPALFSSFADYLRPDNTLTWRVWKRSGKESEGTERGDSSGGGANAAETESAAEEAAAGAEAPPLSQERWYGVRYGVSATPPDLLRAWSDYNGAVESPLSLPGPNLFIPDDFSLVCDRAGVVNGNSNGPVVNNGDSEASDGNGVGDGAGGMEVEEEAGLARGVGTARAAAAKDGGVSVSSNWPTAELKATPECHTGVVKAPDLVETCGEGVSEEGQLWHRLDSSFRQPRAYVRVVLGTPVVGDGGAEAAELANIMSDVIHKMLAQRTYDARLAGLDWKVGPHPCGFVVQVSGFSQKIDPLLQQVLEAFLDPEAAAGGSEAFAKQFYLSKERAVRRTKNWVMGRPDGIAHYYTSKALELPRDPSPDPGNVRAAQAATLEDCLSLHKKALSRVTPVGLVYGNASQGDAKRIWSTLTERLNAAGCESLPESAFPRSLVGVLPAGKRVNLRVDVPNEDDENSATVAYWQLGERDERKHATLVLLSQMMREPCFTELRTKQQIGYIVSSGLHCYGRGSRQLGFSVCALSKTFGPDEICSRVDAFLPQFREILANMSQEDYDQHVESLVTKQLEPPKKADSEFSCLVYEVFTGDLKWGRSAAMAEIVASVTREEVLELLDTEMMAQDNAKRMNVLVYGKGRTRPNEASEVDDKTTIELVPETLQGFTEGLSMQDTTLTPQQAVAQAATARRIG